MSQADDVPPPPPPADTRSYLDIPLPGERSAPFFDGRDDPGIFLDDYDRLARKYALEPFKKKELLPCYASREEVELWRSLPQYSDLTKSFEELVMEIKKFYGSPYFVSRADIDTLVQQQRAIGGIRSLEEFNSYYRRFITKAQPLMSRNVLSSREAAQLFILGLGEALTRSTAVQLDFITATKSMNRNPLTEPYIYSIEDIVQAVFTAFSRDSIFTQVLAPQISESTATSFVAPTGPATFYPPQMTLSYSTLSQPSAPYQPFSNFPTISPPAPIVPVQAPVVPKVEDSIQQLLQQNNQMLSGLTAALTQFMNQSPKRACFFCGSSNHTVRGCNEAKKYVNEGIVIQDGNRFKMREGTEIPFARGETLKTHIDQFRQTPTRSSNMYIVSPVITPTPTQNTTSPQSAFAIVTETTDSHAEVSNIRQMILETTNQLQKAEATIMALEQKRNNLKHKEHVQKASGGPTTRGNANKQAQDILVPVPAPAPAPSSCSNHKSNSASSVPRDGFFT